MRLTDVDTLLDVIYKIDRDYHSSFDAEQGRWVHDIYISEKQLMTVLRQLDVLEIPLQTTYRGKHEVKL